MIIAPDVLMWILLVAIVISVIGWIVKREELPILGLIISVLVFWVNAMQSQILCF